MKQRSDHDRRDFDSRQPYPFLDIRGRIILEERRKMPDRRLNSIKLELVTLPPSEMPPDWKR